MKKIVIFIGLVYFILVMIDFLLGQIGLIKISDFMSKFLFYPVSLGVGVGCVAFICYKVEEKIRKKIQEPAN